jgi:hypothetical protein
MLFQAGTMAQSRKMCMGLKDGPRGAGDAGHHRTADRGLRGWLRRCSARRGCGFGGGLIAAALWVPCCAIAAWGCHGPKPGHPTAEERAAFVREVSALAVTAEKTHGVPASALAAMAIAESSYGYTRIALHANNLFAWKFVPAAAKTVKEYVLRCAKRRNARFAAFDSKAHAFDFVASKLATLDAYRAQTVAYRQARSRGVAADAAVKAWIAGVASVYSRKPAAFMRKIERIMNDPLDPRDTRSAQSNLYRLSAAVHGR